MVCILSCCCWVLRPDQTRWRSVGGDVVVVVVDVARKTWLLSWLRPLVLEVLVGPRIVESLARLENNKTR